MVSKCGYRKYLKLGLVFESLGIVAILMMIKNFIFITHDENGVRYAIRDFINVNAPLIGVYFICVVILLFGILGHFVFEVMRYDDKPSGVSFESYEEDRQGSLDFLMAIILPLIIDDVNTWQGAASFIITIVVIAILIYNTGAYYNNPILDLLGYRVYKVCLKNNKDFDEGEYIAISKGAMQKENNSCVAIEDDIIFVQHKG
ncbi:MAG: hypothetical protein R3Y65_09330 [Bacillota bacterium]